MTGDLIQFQKHRDLKKVELCRHQAVPSVAAADVHHASIVDWRAARIARLLAELEELTRLAKDLPPPLQNQARDGLERARRVVGSSTAAVDLRGAPQPELDDERIERMYRELNHHM